MRTRVGVRFWVELAMGLTSLALFVLTSLWPQWIELVFGADPDGGSGEAEWGLVAVFAAATVVLLWTARAEWRRGRRERGLRLDGTDADFRRPAG